MRQPAAPVKPRRSKFASFPAPVGGWIANTNLSAPGARLPDGTKVTGAAMLENWFPTATGIRMRGGSQQHAVIGTEGAQVTSLFRYINGNNAKMFAANATAIYDVTTPTQSEDLFYVNGAGSFYVDHDGKFVIKSGTPDASVGSLTGGDWSVIQFATSGGVFLRCVNGLNTPLVFDGTTWGTTPAITGLTASELSYVWSFKNRLFFIQKDTLDAWYLDVDAIGGAATKLPLGGVFARGGSLLFGSTWSLDTGSGLSEQCVFITTEGEVAVYQGSNPGDANAWSKVGVYRIGKPRGAKAWVRAGGDIVIATDIGFVPLSQAIQRDFSVIAPAAVSYPIEDEWNKVVKDRSQLTWQGEVWPTKQMVALALPGTSSDHEYIFVANARTGAWAKYTGWGATCILEFLGRFFFGTFDGHIIEGEVTGLDRANSYTAVCVPLFDNLKAPASLKSGLEARIIYRAHAEAAPRLSLQYDYNISLPAAPDDETVDAGNIWGAGVWGTSTWGEAAQLNSYQEWQSTPGGGYAVSVATQITSGSASSPNVEMVQTDLTYDIGDVGT